MSIKEQRPGWLLWFVPLVSFSVIALALTLPILWDYADLDPTPIGYMRLAGAILTMVILGFLLVWYFGFTRVSRRTKGISFILMVLLASGAVASIEEVVLTANLFPSFRFRWQQAPEAKLAEYLQEQTDLEGLPPIDLTIDPVNDFPRYRGLLADGVVRTAELLDVRWTSGKPRERWRHPCGWGFSGIVVAGNVAVTVEQRDENEAVVCYDRATGKQRWVYSYPARFTDPTGKGPRATPSILDGEVYSLGAMGDLVCLEGTTGKRKWQVNILDDNQAKPVRWGMTSSPLVVEDLVIVNAGIDPGRNVERALVAYARKDGKRVWGTGKYKAGYSSPQVATLAGKRQVLLFDAGGLAGHDLKTGEELWRHPWTSYEDMNIIQPLVVGEDRVFLSSEVMNGCALLRIVRQGEKFTVEEVWANKFLPCRQANPVLMGGHIYGLANGTLVCLEAETGRRCWRGRFYGQGQLLGVAGMLLIQSEQGDLALVAADPRRFQQVDSLPVFPERRTWNTPALAGRELYLRNDTEMVCYELPLKE